MDLNPQRIPMPTDRCGSPHPTGQSIAGYHVALVSDCLFPGVFCSQCNNVQFLGMEDSRPCECAIDHHQEVHVRRFFADVYQPIDGTTPRVVVARRLILAIVYHARGCSVFWHPLEAGIHPDDALMVAHLPRLGLSANMNTVSNTMGINTPSDAMRGVAEGSSSAGSAQQGNGNAAQEGGSRSESQHQQQNFATQSEFPPDSGFFALEDLPLGYLPSQQSLAQNPRPVFLPPSTPMTYASTSILPAGGSPTMSADPSQWAQGLELNSGEDSPSEKHVAQIVEGNVGQGSKSKDKGKGKEVVGRGPGDDMWKGSGSGSGAGNPRH
ncbi:hypothetical protein B0T16DRAFT_457427 [Cercophora newfieldiana]|uniref:Uncharacterized protein n=1 Tax=Cercophora newfieldiana TaxID=92897 RepID=A0AA39Y3K4_9PEZI|nr:hypothetical protein B0T16DRAFT_457427 [Cercophora newfieldiana]